MDDGDDARGLPIVVERAGVNAGGTRVLDRISLTIPARGRTFILGANGAGKSTLLRLMHGLIAPDSGSITWGGKRTRPRGQAMVFQRPRLLRRSAAANIRHALALAGIRGPDADARIDEAIASVGLDAIAGRSARVLSGGEQQRLALARAWALRPDVLFLDEPTAGLDPAAARAVESIVAGIHSRGTTIVMTTHNLAQARRLADSIAFISAGSVVEHTGCAQFFGTPVSAEGRAFIDNERL